MSAGRAEVGVLGAILIDGGIFPRVREYVSADDFTTEANRVVFEAIGRLAERGMPIDLVTTITELERSGDDGRTGGAGYVAMLVDYVPDVENAVEYAKLVHAEAQRRALVSEAQLLAAKAASAKDAGSVLEEAWARIGKMMKGQTRGGLLPADGIVTGNAAALERVASTAKPLGVLTGFRHVDALTCGLVGGGLYIVAARPGMGKTAFVVNAAMNQSLRLGKRVGFFSLEMSASELLLRAQAGEAHVGLQDVRRWTMTREQRRAFMLASARISRAPFYVDDSPAASVRQIRARAMRLKETQGLDILYVDYIQIMGGSRREQRHVEVGEYSAGLKAIAKELDVPVVALAQLSRKNEQRDEKEPVLSDLRESGSIEQDADLVMFIHRPAYYDVTAPPRQAKFIVAKQRSGPLGTFSVGWLPETTRFEDFRVLEAA